MLFQDNFTINNIDIHGKAFDHVSRLEAVGESSETKLTLDFNSDLYKAKSDEKISFVITNTLRVGGSVADDSWEVEGPSLLDDSDYAMSGTIFKIDGNSRGEEQTLLINSQLK